MGEAYFQRSLIVVLLLGIAGGVAGTHVLLRRLSFYVVALSHATFPALVLAVLLGLSTLLAGVLGCAVVAALVAGLGRSQVSGHSNAIGVVLGGAFALGIALVTAFPERIDASALLVGSLVGVDDADVRSTGLAVLVALAGFALLHKELVLGAFDPIGASAAGYRTAVLDFTMMVLLGFVVVASVPAVGSLLNVALVVAPPLAARALTTGLGAAMALSALLGVVSGVGGLVLSVLLDAAAGGAIAVTAAALLLAAMAASQLRHRTGGWPRRLARNTATSGA